VIRSNVVEFEGLDPPCGRGFDSRRLHHFAIEIKYLKLKLRIPKNPPPNSKMATGVGG
jgi:hypothetical protein